MHTWSDACKETPAPLSRLQARCTEGRTRSTGREGGDGNGNGNGKGVRDGKDERNGNGNGKGAGQER